MYCTKGLVIKGSIRYLTGCYPTAINVISSEKINVRGLITNRFKFKESEKAFELVKMGREDVIRGIIEGV